MDERHYDFDPSFFDEAPSEEHGPIGLPVKRAPSRGSDVWTILSERIFGCWTHYYRRRTQPCLGAECPICSDQCTRRWYGWLVGYDVQRRVKVLVEVPPGVALALRTYRGQHGNLRGHAIKLSRKNGKENGQVVAQFAQGKYSSELLPPCPDIVPLLMRMWQVKSLEHVDGLGGDLRIHQDEFKPSVEKRPG